MLPRVRDPLSFAVGVIDLRKLAAPDSKPILAAFREGQWVAAARRQIRAVASGVVTWTLATPTFLLPPCLAADANETSSCLPRPPDLRMCPIAVRGAVLRQPRQGHAPQVVGRLPLPRDWDHVGWVTLSKWPFPQAEV